VWLAVVLMSRGCTTPDEHPRKITPTTARKLKEISDNYQGGSNKADIAKLGALVAREIANDSVKGGEPLIRPVAHDPHLAAHVAQVFKQLEDLAPDNMLAEQSLLFCLMHALQKHGIDGPRPVRASPSMWRSISPTGPE